MKKNLLRSAALFVLAALLTQTSFAQLTGTYSLPGTVGATTVNNLTQLATLLNSSTVTGTVVFEFNSTYTTTGETYPIVFNAFAGTGSVIIRPAASVTTPLTTSGAPTLQALIALSGAKNITFDGRSGGAGSALNWQFLNTGTSSNFPVFQFINGAQYDVLKYLNVQGNSTAATGNINFSTTTGVGNSFDTITNCKVTSYTVYPYAQIYSLGTAANPNSNNSILNNDISNFRASSGTGMPNQGGIIITTTGNGSNWNISNNSIYCTGAPYVYSQPLGGISFGPGTASTGNIISGNYIGGQAPLCTGGKMKVMSYQANGYPDFDGIYNACGSVTMNYNTIQNIYMGSSTGSSTFCGINISGSGSAQLKGNVVGNPTDTNNIVSGINGTMLGIYNHSSGGTVNIDSSIVANLTANYRAFISGTSSQTPGAITGIYNYGGSGGNIGATTITNNRVFNLTTASNYNNNLYFYINGSSNGANFPASTYNNAQNNIVCGIFMEQDNTNTNTQLISKNVVYGLSTTVTGGSFISYISGITANGNTSGTNIINGNMVYGLYAPNTFGTSGTYYIGLTGIWLPTSKAGKYFVQDNIIDLGYRPTDGSSVQNALIYGIWENNYNQNSTNLKEYIYHNSVHIGGTDNSQVYSFAFARNLNYSSTVYDSLTIMNNIFVNNRTSTNASSRAYGLYLNSTIDVKDDYNDVYGTGAHYYYGAANGTSYLDAATFLTGNAGHEANSIASDPHYVSPTTATPNLHISNSPSMSPIEQAGTTTYTIVYDYDSLIRASYSPVDLGATVSCSASPVSVSLTASNQTICPGTSVIFTATATNGGTPVYTFYKNGVSVQNGSSNTYTTTTLANNDSVKVMVTGNSPCASVNTAYSNSITITVNTASVTPTVGLTASQTSVCAGTQVTFTAAGTNPGSTPIYKFYKNGVLVQNSAATTYSNSALSNNDSVWVTLVSNAACVSPDSARSSRIIITVSPSVTPGVSLSASQTMICTGTSVTFTAAGINSGSTPVYTFYRNGSSVQTGAATTYTTTTLSNNDSVWVVLTSNAACATTTTATSVKIRITVTTSVTPSVTISASQNNVCAGTSLIFTAAATNGGSTPNFSFYKNGVSVQNGIGTTYTTSTLNNNDSVWVILTSNASCAATTTATSTKVYMVITAAVTPTVSLTASQVTICSGASVTFTAAGTNSGTPPVYTFYKNGSSVQSGTAATYVTTTLAANDSVWVVLTSNAPCATTTTATSTKVRVTVTATVTPTVSITASQSTICAGAQVTFTAAGTNGGGAPTYTFYKNGVSMQTGATTTYSTTALNNNDSIWVVLTSNAACATTTTATSTKQYITVTAAVTPAVSINATQTTICAGTQVTFTATGTNGGTAPTYNFYKNGVSVQNGSSTTYNTTTLNNNDSVWVVITSNAACASIPTATSTKIRLAVTTSVTPTISLTASQTTICVGTQVTFTAAGANGGAAPTYTFYKNGVSVQTGAGLTYTTTALNNNDSVWVVLTSNATCATTTTATSAKVRITVSTSVTPTVTITASQTTICAGTQVTFTASGTNGGSAPAYVFYKNGVSVQSGSATTYSSTALINNDSLWVVLTSNSTCATTTTATSTKIHLTVNPNVTPTVVLTASQNNTCAGSNVTFTAAATNGGISPTYQFLVNGSSVQTGAGNTFSSAALGNSAVVKVTLTSNAACATTTTAIDSVIVNVFSPAATALADSICAGGSYLFAGRTLTQAGVYRDTLTTTHGCDSIVTLTLSIAATPSAVIYQYGADTLATTPFAIYQWYRNNVLISGATSQIYVAHQSGSYTVAVTNGSGCKDTSAAYTFTGVGIKDVTGNIDIRVYPNPTSGEVNIQFDNPTGTISVKLYDVQGRTILSSDLVSAGDNIFKMNISQCAAGIYYLHINDGNNSAVQKVEVVK